MMKELNSNYISLLCMADLQTAIDTIFWRANELTDEQVDKLEFAMWAENQDRKAKEIQAEMEGI